MAKIKFLLQSKNNPANIYARLSVSGKESFKRKTGFSIDPAEWKNSFPTQKSINSKNVANNLRRLESYIYESLNSSVGKDTNISGDWLQRVINEFNNVETETETESVIFATEVYLKTSQFRKNAKGGFGVSLSRVKSILRFQNTIKDFQNEILKKEWLLSDVNNLNVEKFRNWMLSRNYKINYIGKNLSDLKMVCRVASDDGISVNPYYTKIEKLSENKKPEDIIYLSIDELKSIEKLKLKQEYLNNARKWLILGCFIGQRVSDLLSIKENHIKKIEGVNIIELTQIKTGKKIAVPLLPEAERIINSGFPTSISDVKFNEYIKVICEKAKINGIKKGSKRESGKNGVDKVGDFQKWELISSHVCRRSFATNFYGKIPTPVLMSITGHSKESTFLNYIGKTSYENAMQMMDYVKKLKK